MYDYDQLKKIEKTRKVISFLSSVFFLMALLSFIALLVVIIGKLVSEEETYIVMILLCATALFTILGFFMRSIFTKRALRSPAIKEAMERPWKDYTPEAQKVPDKEINPEALMQSRLFYNFTDSRCKNCYTGQYGGLYYLCYDYALMDHRIGVDVSNNGTTFNPNDWENRGGGSIIIIEAPHLGDADFVWLGSKKPLLQFMSDYHKTTAFGPDMVVYTKSEDTTLQTAFPSEKIALLDRLRKTFLGEVSYACHNGRFYMAISQRVKGKLNIEAGTKSFSTGDFNFFNMSLTERLEETKAKVKAIHTVIDGLAE